MMGVETVPMELLTTCIQSWPWVSPVWWGVEVLGVVGSMGVWSVPIGGRVGALGALGSMIWIFWCLSAGAGSVVS